jgi:hypothetical protein
MKRARAGAVRRAERPAAPTSASASRETRLALLPSKSAQADSEPRRSLPSGDRPTHPAGEGLS